MICSDLLIYKVFPKQNNISLYDRGTKSYVRLGHNVTVALRTAHPRWRFESSCPTKVQMHLLLILKN